MAGSTISTFIDAAELLCGQRDEQFPYERHLVLGQHLWWAFEPNEEVYRDFTLLAAARIYLSVQASSWDGAAHASAYYVDSYLTPSKFAEFVQKRQTIHDFRWYIAYHSDGQIRAHHIANYLLSASASEATRNLVSLNKAYFYVRAKADDHLNTSRRILIVDWQRYRRTVPVLLWWFKKPRLRPSYFELPDPTAEDFLARLDRLVTDSALMHQFFSVCLSYHFALSRIFSDGSVGFPRVDRMPKFLEEYNIMQPPLSKHDLNRMARYKSPNH